MRLDSSLRWNDEDSTSVIPGEQRETRNPGAYTRGKGVLFLSSNAKNLSERPFVSLRVTTLVCQSFVV